MYVTVSEKIQHILTEQPNLTPEQVANILGANLATIKTTLKRMWDKGLIEPTPMPSLTWRGRIYFWKMKGTKARLTEQSYKHHYLGSELYVALKKTGETFQWFHTDDGKDKRWDRALLWRGVWIPIEVHRGTQTVEVVVEKAKHYATQENCRPLWVVTDYRPNPLVEIVKTAKQSGQEILDALRSQNIVAQPLVTPYAVFCKDPLARVLVSPKGYATSLNEL